MPSHALKILLPAILVMCGAHAQSPQPEGEYLPPPDPGYRLFFHEDAGPLVKPQRWGYHDGWLQGRLDRSEGRDQDPKDQAAYTKGLRHGVSVILPEEQYLRVYQNAYLRGYERGYRL